MREIRTSGSMRGDWKHDLFARNGLLIQDEPRQLVRQSSTLRTNVPLWPRAALLHVLNFGHTMEWLPGLRRVTGAGQKRAARRVVEQ
jgi:hypothetical protein